MLLTKEVEVLWNQKTYKRYIEKGYKFTKWGDTFIVPVEDIVGYSGATVYYSCDYCGKEVPVIYGNYKKYHKSNEFVKKDCCSDCVPKKQQEIVEVKNSMGLLNKNVYGYWKYYENRLFELKEFLTDKTIDDLLDNGYSPIRNAILKYKDNIIDMILDSNIDIYNKCSHLSRLVYHLNKNTIIRLFKLFIDEYNHFPTMLEVFEIIQINYVILAKFGGYYKFKEDLGFNNDELKPMLNFKYSVEHLQKYHNVSGIYKITNIKNGKVYIGKAVDLWHRITSGYLYRLYTYKGHGIKMVEKIFI
jgi:hypothetical protein